jgi:hypothetical protein
MFREGRGAAPGAAWYPEERLALSAALRGYTGGPALASGEAGHKGRLASGHLADLVVLSDGLRGERGLREARVDVVIAGGKVVHQRG